MKRILVYIPILILLLSCKKENTLDCFTSNGSDITETRYPGTFKAVMVPDKFEVKVVSGSEYKVEVTCGEHIISNISSKVRNDTLILENKNRCNFVRGYKRVIRFTVTVPQLDYLENSGVGVVTFDEDYKQDYIYVRVSSSGDLYLNGTFRTIKTTSNGNGDMYVGGKADTLYVYTTGINFVNTRALSVANYMFIHTASIGDCYVNATGTKRFAFNIQNTGNIYYSGDPQDLGDVSDGQAKGKLFKE
ncbi:MAG: DUF2807 domain-containing protein [bacterium]|nr:DUF2807 domain-containing protein [bacterium]